MTTSQTGLFSAVLTAFNVESYKGLTQDSSDTSAAALLQISRQLSSLHSNSTALNTPDQAYTSPEFSPSDATVLINMLWFSSLVLSLISASLGILVKRWLREYLTTGYTSPKERIRLRYYRYSQGLIKWRVFEIAALPQLLLHLSLILFFVGLSEFLRQLNPTVGWSITVLIIMEPYFLCQLANKAQKAEQISQRAHNDNIRKDEIICENELQTVQLGNELE